MPAEIGPNQRGNLRCKVDTGAGGNVMPLRVFAKLFPRRITSDGKPTGLRPTPTRLTAYNGSPIPQLGALDTTIDWKPKGQALPNRLHTRWYVADTAGPAILGLPSCSKLGVVQMNCAVEIKKKPLPNTPKRPTTERDTVKQDLKKLQHTTPLTSREDLIEAYPDRFEGIGRFPGTYHISLRDDAKPVVHAPRKCPIAMRPLVREKLDEFLDQGIIVPVEEPTDWVSSLAYSWKANGKLRVCLDPKDLNKAIRRDHYRTPTVEEITHELAGSTRFTKLDGTSSYLCVVLDYESSILTTFNSPWGRYRFVRLPFGLACSQDIFQRMMDQILTRCDGVIGIADDVVVHGKDDAEHDKRLHKFMEVAREHGLVFNKDKCAVRQDSVNFFGCVYDANGAHPDPGKVTAVHAMTPPESPAQLQKFLGMVTYLSPFVPSLSTFTAPLRELLKKDREFTWNSTYQEAFDKVKQIVCKDTTLRYFDVRKPVTLQVDASKKGLGAALLQEGRPVAFASKALTPVEQRYANIEREMLACVFGAERFHTYVFGRAFTVESDHKPLEQINLKNLADTPVRLQRMLLRLQNYDVTVKYRPGKEMLVADALSRYAPIDAPEIPLDITINHVHITPEKKSEFQSTIQDDPLLRSLAETIIAGWPEDIKDVPRALRPYHPHRHILTVEDGLILRGEALIIPPMEREKVLQSIHEGHMGISKCQYRARNCVYWPGINQDIRRLIEACPTCQRHRPQEPRQPLQPTPAPERPWQHLGADFFHFDGSEYLVVMDYYSKMPIVRKIPASQCNAAKTIATLKDLFAEQGIPESLRTDNGPQFANALFTEFATDWKFDHNTSSPRNPRSNGQAEAAVKTVKGLLTRAKYSGQDPYLALLAYRSTPIDAHLRSPAEMLYQRTLRTTVPQRMRHTDPHAEAEREHLDHRAHQSAAHHDRRGCRQKPPLFAGQTVSVLNDARTLWLPATIVRAADHGSYIIQVIGGGQYRRARDHIRERHPDAARPVSATHNVAPATLMQPAIPAAQPTPTVAPATPRRAAPAATPQTPCKAPPAARAQTPSTGAQPSKTGTAPAVPRRSSRASKPPTRLIEEKD